MICGSIQRRLRHASETTFRQFVAWRPSLHNLAKLNNLAKKKWHTMRRLAHFPKPALLVWMTGLLALCQTPPPAPGETADPIIRISVNLVQIEAVVTDSQGRHIAGLGPGDFEVVEDGKPQKITHLSWRNTAPQATPAVNPSLASAGSSKKKTSLPPDALAAPPSDKPHRQDIRRAMVFLVDDIHMSPVDLIELKPVAKKFVAEQFAPGDLVSISAVGGGMGFYEQFTNDRNVLNAAVDSLTKRVGGGFSALGSTEGASDCLRTEILFDAVMGKISWAIRSLKELPGRKGVILFSDGLAIPHGQCQSEAQDMDASMQRVADQSNRSGVSIYAIDSSGLSTGYFTASESSLGSFQGNIGHLAALQETSGFLADETGGLFFHNTNDLNYALGKAMDDMSGYYLIGYQPQRSDFELKHGNAVFHKVEVRLRNRRGLSVRYGKGFLGTPDKSAPAPATPGQEVAEALFSPFDSGGIKVRLTPLYSAPAAGPGGKPNPTVMKALLSIDGSTLHLADADKGSKTAVLDIVLAAYRSDDTPIAADSHEYTLSLKPGDVAKLANGIMYQSEVPIPKPGGYEIRVAVRDSATGLLGTADSFVIVPDFNRKHITLSSLMLSAAQGSDTLSEAAARDFHPGEAIMYVCEIYGTKGSAETEIHLYRDGVRVFDGPSAAVKSSAGASAISVVGKLNLPASLPDGDYEMELIARDPQAPPKQQLTSQWTDLTLAAGPR